MLHHPKCAYTTAQELTGRCGLFSKPKQYIRYSAQQSGPITGGSFSAVTLWRMWRFVFYAKLFGSYWQHGVRLRYLRSDGAAFSSSIIAECREVDYDFVRIYSFAASMMKFLSESFSSLIPFSHCLCTRRSVSFLHLCVSTNQFTAGLDEWLVLPPRAIANSIIQWLYSSNKLLYSILPSHINIYREAVIFRTKSCCFKQTIGIYHHAWGNTIHWLPGHFVSRPPLAAGMEPEASHSRFILHYTFRRASHDLGSGTCIDGIWKVPIS